MGGGLTSVEWSKSILTMGRRLILCQVQNADLVAVSLACPKKKTHIECVLPGLLVSKTS